MYKNYEIISDTDLLRLQQTVNEKLATHYLLVGGVVVDSNNRFYQAVALFSWEQTVTDVELVGNYTLSEK